MRVAASAHGRLHIDFAIHYAPFLDQHHLGGDVTRDDGRGLELHPVRGEHTSYQRAAQDHLAGMDVAGHGGSDAEHDRICPANGSSEGTVDAKGTFGVDIAYNCKLIVEQRVSAGWCLCRGAGAPGKEAHQLAPFEGDSVPNRTALAG